MATLFLCLVASFSRNELSLISRRTSIVRSSMLQEPSCWILEVGQLPDNFDSIAANERDLMKFFVELATPVLSFDESRDEVVLAFWDGFKLLEYRWSWSAMDWNALLGTDDKKDEAPIFCCDSAMLSKLKNRPRQKVIPSNKVLEQGYLIPVDDRASLAPAEPMTPEEIEQGESPTLEQVEATIISSEHKNLIEYFNAAAQKSVLPKGKHLAGRYVGPGQTEPKLPFDNPKPNDVGAPFAAIVEDESKESTDRAGSYFSLLAALEKEGYLVQRRKPAKFKFE